MNRPPRVGSWSKISLLAALAVAGCSALKSRDVPLDASSGLFDEASIRYRVESARINGALREPREGQLVSYEEPLPGKLPANSTASLEIEYPHPEKKPGYGRVLVRIEGQPRSESADPPAWKRWWSAAASGVPGLKQWNSDKETWVLDLRQGEVSAVIQQLQASGYFDNYEKPAEAAEISTELDGTKLSKGWRQVPALDALIVRVRTEGRLISSTKAPGVGDPSQPPANSVVAYRQMLAEDAGVAVASDDAPQPAQPAFVPVIVRLPAVDAPARY